jgi:hypothetical protein
MAELVAETVVYLNGIDNEREKFIFKRMPDGIYDLEDRLGRFAGEKVFL